MAYHTKCLIVHHHNFHRQIFTFYPLQLLDIHLKSSVPTNAGSWFPGGIVSSDGCRKSIAHGSMSAGKKQFLTFAVFEGLITPHHMLSYIHCDGTCILKHITELPDHTVRISLRKGIIHCLKILPDFTAYHHPVTDTLLLSARHFIQCLDQGTCFRQDLDLIFSIFVNIPLKIVGIKVYTDDLRAFCKFIHFGTDLSSTQ